MDTSPVAVGDVAMLDAELLQLPEVAPLAFKSYPDFAQKLFEQWLALPDANRLVPFYCYPQITLNSLIRCCSGLDLLINYHCFHY